MLFRSHMYQSRFGSFLLDRDWTNHSCLQHGHVHSLVRRLYLVLTSSEEWLTTRSMLLKNAVLIPPRKLKDILTQASCHVHARHVEVGPNLLAFHSADQYHDNRSCEMKRSASRSLVYVRGQLATENVHVVAHISKGRTINWTKPYHVYTEVLEVV